jgi:hypothetical protein
MAVAKVAIVAIEISCPHCDETVHAPNGSEYWALNELAGFGAKRCGECGTAFTLPAKVTKLLGW